MKKVLVILFVLFCFSSVSLADLARIYIIVNMDDAPIEILEFGKSRFEDEDHISSVVEIKNRVEKAIEALEVTMVYYDPFNEKEDGVRGISTKTLRAGVSARAGWSTYGNPSFVKTAIAFVSAVRFLDGEVWKADIKEVMKKAGTIPKLEFLSETKMLEIEKK